jgi:diaminopimelate decarboxylase
VIGFYREGASLVCDGTPLDRIASDQGTPLYVYSAATIAARYRAIDEAFAGSPHAIHYALKANSTLAILRQLRALGSHADANSSGEIEVAMRAGFTPAHIVFTGVGKTPAELAHAIAFGVRSINVESPGELDRIDAISRQCRRKTKIAIRVNPDVDARTHPHISTGLKTNKFGIPISDVPDVCARAQLMDGVQVVGLHAHIGSQITDLAPLEHAARALVALARQLRDGGSTIEHLDIGGGLGVSYDGKPVPDAADYARTVLPVLRESGLSIVLEPGRHILAPAGVLLTRVVDVKDAGGGRREAGGGNGAKDPERLFVVMDAGMTELIRPMLYNAFHRIEPVVKTDASLVSADVVGPLCESSDTLGKDRMLPKPEPGELYAVLDTGAYGSVMASNYNRRMLPAEVLVEDGAARVIRRRQTLEDVLALES